MTTVKQMAMGACTFGAIIFFVNLLLAGHWLEILIAAACVIAVLCTTLLCYLVGNFIDVVILRNR